MAGVLAACAPEEENSSQLESGVSSQISLENDGSETKLVVAEISVSPERTQALREIAEKYEADFPETEIEIQTVQSGEEAEKLLE